MRLFLFVSREAAKVAKESGDLFFASSRLRVIPFETGRKTHAKVAKEGLREFLFVAGLVPRFLAMPLDCELYQSVNQLRITDPASLP